MRTLTALLVALTFAGTTGCYARARVGPRAQARMAPLVDWQNQHPEAAREICAWTDQHPGAASELLGWEAGHRGKAHELVAFAAANPAAGVGGFLQSHPNAGGFDFVAQQHPPEAAQLYDWAARHPAAADALLETPHALKFMARHPRCG